MRVDDQDGVDHLRTTREVLRGVGAVAAPQAALSTACPKCFDKCPAHTDKTLNTLKHESLV